MRCRTSATEKIQTGLDAQAAAERVDIFSPQVLKDTVTKCHES